MQKGTEKIKSACRDIALLNLSHIKLTLTGGSLKHKKMETDSIVVRIADAKDKKYAVTISIEMEASAKLRGSGISKRSPESIAHKIEEGKAVIAYTNDGCWVGFAYMEVWGNGEFVSNSGMIVNPLYRGNGVARKIKEKIFELARTTFPQAKIFSITTAAAMMKMNMQLGFEPVIYNDIVQEDRFWAGCKSCLNYGILQDKKHKNCLCTAMLFNPEQKSVKEKSLAHPAVNKFSRKHVPSIN